MAECRACSARGAEPAGRGQPVDRQAARGRPAHPAEEDGARQHGAVARPGWRAEPPAAHTEGPASLSGKAPGGGAGEGEATAVTVPGRPRSPAWARPRAKASRAKEGESCIFRLEKWREAHPFFKLGLGRGGGCATSAARPAPPPFRARPRPRGFRAPQGPEPPPRRDPASPAREASRAAPPPAAGRMEPGPAPRRAWRRGSSTGPASARPRIPGGCKHGSQRYTTPAPALAASHTHTRFLRERTERASVSKFAFPPSVLPVATGARGRQRVNARALAPPSAPSARLPCPRPSCEQRLPRAVAGAPWPAGGHHYLQVIGGAGARGVLLTAAGVRFLSSRWILFFMSMFPSSPLFKLNFPRRGRRGERRPGLCGEGRRKEAAGGGGVVPRGVRRAGVRASGAPGAKLLAGAERNHGGKRGLERGSGLTTAAPGQGPALRLNRRRDAAAAARLHSALRGAARLRSPGCSTD